MIEALLARIRDTVPEIKFLGEMADFQRAVESNPVAVPALFVIEGDESASPSQFSDVVVSQRVRATVGLVLVVRNLSDANGEAAKSELRQLRQLVKAQVFGWQATAEFDPFERGQSHLLAFRDGHVWWQDQYLTSFYDRSVL
ncbi:MAG: hypothetical protein M3Y65_21720 [Pseudomonadota bacterium]|nr:hypothetical protein [Pseudomonadota bacterium]